MRFLLLYRTSKSDGIGSLHATIAKRRLFVKNNLSKQMCVMLPKNWCRANQGVNSLSLTIHLYSMNKLPCLMILSSLLPQPLPRHTHSTVIHTKIVPHLSPLHFSVNNKELTPTFYPVAFRISIRYPPVHDIVQTSGTCAFEEGGEEAPLPPLPPDHRRRGAGGRLLPRVPGGPRREASGF